MRPALTAELAQKLVAVTMMSCAHFAKSVDLSSPVPAPPGTVVRSVEVYPNANKNKAFPLPEGSGMCDLHLNPKNPWRIRHSDIDTMDDQTLWRKVNDYEYYMAYGYAPNEYVVIKGDLYKPSTGGGKGDTKIELPKFLVTVPKVNLNWDAKHGDAAKEECEDDVPAAILVSADRSDFGSLVIYGPKDDFSISSPEVTLLWDNANKIKVYDGVTEIRSGHKFSIMQGATKTLLVQALESAADVKFTLEGESDNVNGEKAVDYVHACCVVLGVAKIRFNYLENSLQDGAVEIKQGYKLPFNGIKNGEWIRDVKQNYPVCYVTNTQAKIMVSFIDKTKSVQSAKISAVIKNGDHIIKPLKSKIVKFKNGKSDPEEVEFEMETPLPAVITSGQDVYQWRMEDVNGNATPQYVMGETGPHKIYVILGEPKLPWVNQSTSDQCPWTNALEFAINKAGAKGQGTDKGALSAITTYLHSGHGLVYDTIAGAPRYLNLNTGVFLATSYIKVANRVGVTNLVNCYDQAYGVVTFGNLIGPLTNAIPRFTEPFGYINKTKLVGVGTCNNPFYRSVARSPYVSITGGRYHIYEGVPPNTIICNDDDKMRTWFGNHMYATFVLAGTNYVFDACAGPYVGNICQSEYLKKTIDQSTEEERVLGYFTTPAMLINYFQHGVIDEDQNINFAIE